MRVKTCMGLERFEVKKFRVFTRIPGIPRNHGTPGSCLKSAENQAASSIWVGGHHYTSILCLSNSYGQTMSIKLSQLLGQ